jgi:hypothetical protein
MAIDSTTGALTNPIDPTVVQNRQSQRRQPDAQSSDQPQPQQVQSNPPPPPPSRGQNVDIRA